MRRPVLALACAVCLAGGLSACGGSGDVHDVVPKTTPDLVAPENASLPAAAGNSDQSSATPSTTASTATPSSTGASSGTGGTTAGTGGTSSGASSGGTSAGTTGTGGTSGGTTGGTTGGGTSGGTGGTSTTNSGGFSDFCQQNPGACPG